MSKGKDNSWIFMCSQTQTKWNCKKKEWELSWPN